MSSRKHVKFHATGSVTLTHPASKTNPYRTRTDIQLASSISPLCPVKALTKLFRLHPKGEDDPLIILKIYRLESLQKTILRRPNQGITPPDRHQYLRILWALHPHGSGSIRGGQWYLKGQYQIAWKMEKRRRRRLYQRNLNTLKSTEPAT